MIRPTRRLATRTTLLAAGLAAAFAFGSPSAIADKPASQGYDQFIVRFKDGSAEHRQSAARQQRLDAVGRAQGLRIGQLRRLAVGADVIRTERPLDPAEVKALINQLRADPRVAYAEVDLPVQAMATPNDTSYASQWHYYEPVGGINAPAAWDFADGSGQVVAVLDTGITDHPDLAANVVAGYDFISGTFASNDGDGRDADASDPGDAVVAPNVCLGGNTPRTSSWHGTHVAGTIAAVTDNNVGVAGIAHGARVQPVRVLGRCGGASSDIGDAIVWASGGTVSGVPANATPARVINLSLGGSGGCLASTQAAIDTAVANGATVVIAAGNSNANASSFQPASCRNILTVAATSRTGARSYYSNYGATVDIAAPGGESPNLVLSTLNAGATAPGAPSYAGYQGTSMAAPHVAGVAALVRDASGDTLSPAVLMALLQGTSRPLPVACAQGCGAGIVDAGAAVQVANLPLLMVGDATPVLEGNAGTVQLTFTVSLSEPLASDVTFDVATADGTATAGSDYVAFGATAQVLAAGETSKTFTVTVNGDGTGEHDESLQFQVDNVAGPAELVVVDDAGRGTIRNDDVFVLANNVPLNGLADDVAGHGTYFSLVVPPNATNLEFEIGGGSGDADLYVRHGALPTRASGGYTCRVATTGSYETCPVAATPGTWYGMVYAFSPYSGLTLRGSYSLIGISVGDAQVTEGDTGTQLVTFTVSLSAAGNTAVTYDIATADGSAVAGSDYVAAGATGETIAAGQLSRTFAVAVNGDVDVEGDEDFLVQLANVGGATVADAAAVGTITGDDLPVLSIGDASVTEGDGGEMKQLTFTVSLSEVVGSPVYFRFATGDGSADEDDYLAAGDGTWIPAGQLSKTISVAIRGDELVEADETFVVDLTEPQGATLGDAQGTGTIRNDDVARLSIGDATIDEGGSEGGLLQFPVSLSTPALEPVTFHVATADGSAIAGSDYRTQAATGVIAAGDTSATFSVEVFGDEEIEADETLRVEVTDVDGADVADAEGDGTIVNDDLPRLSVDDASVTEGDDGTRQMTFTVSLSQVVASDVYFELATADGSALGGSDYEGTSTGAWIPAGQLAKTVPVAINGDETFEGDETFVVELANPAGATVSDGQGTGTIRNDDFVQLSIGDAVNSEGDGGDAQLDFVVSLSEPADAPVSFDLATIDGSALAGSDYAANSASGITIAAGDTSATFSVAIHGDTLIEADETVRVDVANVVGAEVAVAQGTGTIANDDLPQVSIANASVAEGNSGTTALNFAVQLSQAVPFPVTFGAKTYDMTATAGSDYVARNVQGLVIPAGQLAAMFTITVNGDTSIEPGETLVAELHSVVGAQVVQHQGLGTIRNDDGPSLSIGDAVVTEGDDDLRTLNFPVRLSSAMPGPVSFTWTTEAVAGTATPDSDYEPVTEQVEVIPAGQLSALVSVTVRGDTVFEPSETVRVDLTAPEIAISDDWAMGTIVNDDGPKLSIADAGFQEGNSGSKTLNFTVSLSQASATPVSFNAYTVDGMAKAGSDFEGKSLTGLVIPAGQLTRTFSIATYGDTAIEGNETLFVRLANASVPVSDGQARGMLVNDDGPVLSIGDAVVTEGNSGTRVMTFIVSLSKPASAKVTFNLGTANVTAAAGSDFDPLSLTGATIPYGQLSRAFSVIVRGDTQVEPNETLRANISLGNVSILDGVGVGTIVNDDPAP